MTGGSTEHPAWCSNLVAVSRVCAGELVVIAVDEDLVSRVPELRAAFIAAGARVEVETLDAEPLEELSAEVEDRARKTDVRISMWARPRRQTAGTRRLLTTVRSRGGRLVGMPLVTAWILEDQASRPLVDLRGPVERALSALEGLAELRLRGVAGTDISVTLDGSAWQTDALPLRAGSSANFPYGEIFALPTSANGLLVADLTIPFVSSGLLDEPVAIQFADGMVVAVEGGRAAVELQRLLEDAGDDAVGVAEVGLGMNPELAPCGHVLIDEKAAGTAHIAIGGNAHMGGTKLAPIHIDCVFTLSSVSSGGEPIPLN